MFFISWPHDKELRPYFMNRRELMYGLGALSIGVTIEGGSAVATGKGQTVATARSGDYPLPSVVAGVRLVDQNFREIDH